MQGTKYHENTTLTFFTLLVLPKQCIIWLLVNQKFQLNINSYITERYVSNHATFFFKYLNFPAKNTILTLFLPKHSIICHLINHNLFICQKFEYLVILSLKDLLKFTQPISFDYPIFAAKLMLTN